jgi:hypothetical protein
MSKTLFILTFLTITNTAIAESYRTFVDDLGQNTVAFTISGSKREIVSDEITLNGETLPIVKTAEYLGQGGDDGIKIISKTGITILEIPANAHRYPWNMQDPKYEWFTDGDSRHIVGNLIINGKPEKHLNQINSEE